MTGAESCGSRAEQGIRKEDLQLAMRPRLGKQAVVVKSTSESLLPPGENFACSISKVRAVVRRRPEEDEETVLDLVAKTFPAARVMQHIFDFTTLFGKEIFFYEKLGPAYQRLDRDFGGANDGFQIGPDFYGARSSLRKDGDEIDDSVIILMENLKVKGYYTGDKLQGLDLEHSKMAIRALAKFHALGIACKRHRPEFFSEEVLARARIVPFKELEEGNDIFLAMYQKMVQDPRIAAYSDRIDKIMSPESKRLFFTYRPEEPWLTVIHMDFWTNNILFHRNEQGHLDDIKIIDFQNYDYNSPLRDLPYFLCSSTTHEVMTQHLDELLDLYYETLIELLEKMKCDVAPFTRQAFEAQLKIDAGFEFFHNILAIKFFTAEIDKNTYDQSQVNEVVIMSDVNQLGYDKWYEIILTYIKKGWL